MADLINSIIDINVISKEVETTLLQLGSIDKRMEELSKKAITLHFEVKKDESMSTLLAHMKEYGKMVSEISQKEKEHAAVSAKLEAVESKFAASLTQVQNILDSRIGTIEQNIALQRKYQNSIKETSAKINENKQLYDDEAKKIERLDTKIKNIKRSRDELAASGKEKDGFGASIKGYNSTLKELQEIYDRVLEKADKYDRKIDQLKLSQATSKEALSETNIMIRQQAKEMNAAETSITALGLRLGQMKKAYREMTEEERNSPIGKALLQNIQQLDAQVKKLDASIGNHQRNVGNYGSAMDGLKGAIGGVTKVLGAFGISIGAVNLIKSGFNNTMKATNDIAVKYDIVMAQAKAATDYFFRAVASGDWSNFMEGIGAAMNAAEEYERIMHEVRNENRAADVENAKLRAESLKYRNEMRDRTKSNEERIKAGEIAMKNEEKILENNRKSAEKERDAIFDFASKNHGMSKDELILLTETYHLREDEIKQAKELIDLRKKLKEEEKGSVFDTKVHAGTVITTQTVDTDKLATAQKAYEDYYKTLNEEQIIFANQFEKYGKVTEEVRDKLAAAAKKGYEAEASYQTSITRTQGTVSGLRKEIQEEDEANAEKTRKSLEKISQLETKGNLKALKEIIDDDKKSFEVRRSAVESYYNAVKKGAEDTAKFELQKANLLPGEIAEIEAEKTDAVEEAGRKREEMLENLAKEELKVDLHTLEQQAKSFEKGSREQYEARVNLFNEQERIEVEKANEIGKSVEDINKFYDQKRLNASDEYIKATIEKAQEEAAARARGAQDAQIAEEAALLEQYKKGEINEEKYNKGVADIRHKYSVQALKDEIGELEKLLTTVDLTADQRKAIDEKLYDAKKELSDEETEHEIENIKKVEAWRKKAADTAKDLAKQAFDMAMEFLTMQSEAKIEEFDAELERIDEMMEKQLEELDNAVMSDETRAAEEKRIRDKAKADSDKIEAEKRKEQQKQAIYQKAQSTVQAIINTAQAITAALTIPPPAGPILAGINAALGAAQVAVIAIQQIPKYAKGVYDDESHPGGYAVIGDARKREYVLTPSGKLYETPAVPTLVDMTKGTQVFPDYQTMMQYFRPEIPKYETNTTAQYEFESMKKELVLAIKTSKATQQVQMNLDNNGIWYVANSKSGRRRHINSFMQGKA